MKQVLKKTLEAVAKVILKSAEKEVNCTCFFIGYQPELPPELKKIKSKGECI